MTASVGQRTVASRAREGHRRAVLHASVDQPTGCCHVDIGPARQEHRSMHGNFQFPGGQGMASVKSRDRWDRLLCLHRGVMGCSRSLRRRRLGADAPRVWGGGARGWGPARLGELSNKVLT
jgi:hypothetical protein